MALPGWIREHRLLLVVYGGAALLAAFELSGPGVEPGVADDPSWFLDPEVNIVDVSEALHPERANTLYYRAFQASLCASLGPQQAETCRERGPVRQGEIRELLERSLATGNRSNELALYNYALVLLQEGASRDRVEQAVRAWRAAYPRSLRPDPREAFAEMRRGARRSR